MSDSIIDDVKVKKTAIDTAAIQSIAALKKAAGEPFDKKASVDDSVANSEMDKKQEIEFSFEDALAQTFSVLGRVAGGRYGEHCFLSDDEAGMMGKAWAAYINSVVNVNESPLALALGVSAVMIAPRAAFTIMELKKGVESGSKSEKPTE